MTEPAISVKRPKSIRKLPESWIHEIEDKQLDWLERQQQLLWQSYQQQRFWPAFWAWCLCFLIVPPLLWWSYRRRIPEWQQWHEISEELKVLHEQRNKRHFWKKWRPQKNLVASKSFEEVRRFYARLQHSAKQYNARVDLFDYVLDRQSKGLDQPFTVVELESISKTFQQVHDSIASAKKLLSIAEAHPEMDFAELIQQDGFSMKPSSDYVSDSLDVAGSGKWVQELLILENELHQEISKLG